MYFDSARLIKYGICTILLGGVLIVALPVISNAVVHGYAASGQSALWIVEAIVRVIAAIVPPFGASLLAAGLVLQRLFREAERQDSGERPRTSENENHN